MRARTATALFATASLSGCGASYSVDLRNLTDDPVQVDIVEHFATGDVHDQPSALLAVGGRFRYQVRDGRRADGRWLLLSLASQTAVEPVRVVVREFGRLSGDIALDQGRLVFR